MIHNTEPINAILLAIAVVAQNQSSRVHTICPHKNSFAKSHARFHLFYFRIIFTIVCDEKLCAHQLTASIEIALFRFDEHNHSRDRYTQDTSNVDCEDFRRLLL